MHQINEKAFNSNSKRTISVKGDCLYSTSLTDRTKHTLLDKNYIKDNLDYGQKTIPYIKSVD